MDLFYHEAGEGAPLVILHGLLGAGDNWLSVARGMKSRFRSFLPDLRNHGSSPWTGAFTYDDLAADVLAFADSLGLERFYLLGHSMGGKAAMRCALAAPERIGGLVVADISPRPYRDDLKALVESMLGLDLARVRTRGEADEALRLAGVAEPWVRSFLLKNLASKEGGFAWKCNLEAILASFGSIADWTEDGFAPFGGEALFLRGEKSKFIPEEDFPAIRRAFPRARIVSVPGAGHWLQADNPEFVIRELEEFLV